MSALEFVDPRLDPSRTAKELGISREAVELYLDCDVIDLHVDSFIWTRIFGYDLTKRHTTGLLRGCFLWQSDIPRLLEGGVTGATWVISTNPLRAGAERVTTFLRNVQALRDELGRAADYVAVVRTAAEYRAARERGKHGAFIGVQGGNAFDHDVTALDRLPELTVLRVTVVHLTSSGLGATSSPLRGRNDPGLTPEGKDFVRALEDRRVFPDLAHVSKRGFWDAVDAHDPARPLIVTHTGVSGVHPHWRNLDDDQIRAVAETGGTVGIMFQSTFLGDPLFGGRSESIVDHLEHVISVGGERAASIGSDYDGAIVPPVDMRSCLEMPRLVEHMLRRGWPVQRVRNVLGLNALSTIEAMRG